MDRRELIDRRLAKLEADLPDPVPEPAPGEEGLRQIRARFESGEASPHDYGAAFAAEGERLRELILDRAQWWDTVRHTPEHLRLNAWIPRLVLEIVVTPPEEPTPAHERSTLLWIASEKGNRCKLENTWRWEAVLALMAMGGPDGLPLRREFARRRAAQPEESS